MAWHTLNPALMDEINSNDRCPFKVPDSATSQNGRTRWPEIVTIAGTDYKEETKDNGDQIGIVELRVRVSEQYSTDQTNRGKTLSVQKRINYTALENRTKDGQYTMSEISVRQLTSLLLATGVVSDRKQIGSFGDFFAAGTAKINGATVIAQIEQSTNRNGEPQQEPSRFAPFTVGR